MVGTWKLLKSVAVPSGGADSIDTGELGSYDFLKVSVYLMPSGGNIHGYMYFNGDGTSTGNYARRGCSNGGSGSTSGDFEVSPDDEINFTNQVNETCSAFFAIANPNSSTGKQITAWEQEDGGSDNTTSPDRFEWSFKYKTTGRITSIQVKNNLSGSSNFAEHSYITVWGASDDTVTDEKTTITNIPANTRYEEVDTRKIYRFKESDTLEQLNGSGNKTIMTNGNEAHYGIKINTGSDLVGKVISKVHFKIKQNENPTTENLVYVRLWRGSSFVHTFGTTDPDNIAIGTYTFYSFGTGGDFSTSSDGNATLQAGDRIVLSWDRGGSYNNTYIHMQYSTTSQYEGTSDSTSTTVSPTQESHWNDNATRDVTFKLEGSSGSVLEQKWVERGSA